MIEVAKKRRLGPFLAQWGLISGMALSLLAFLVVTGWWQAACLSAYAVAVWTLYAERRLSLPGLIIFAMLPAIQKKIDSLDRWQRTAKERVIVACEPFEDEILYHNTEAQLYQRGVDSTGRPVKPPYTPYTVQLKRQKGQPTDRVTLRDTGDFHDSFEVLWLLEGFLISATDWKSTMLGNMYGEAIFGLDEPGKQALIDLIREPLFQDFKNTVL